MSLPPIACVDSGIDYLTCTYNDTVDFSRLGLFVNRVKHIEQREGNKVQNWGLMGYKGERVGGLEWGTRPDGSIVRLTGFSAQRWWRRFGALATNCSRIDVQQTMVYDEPWSKTTARHFREMRAHWLKNQHRPRPKEIGGPTGIETIYSGERTSDQWPRIYHRGSKKGNEDCQGHIRYEVEIKGDRAHLTLVEFLRSRDVHQVARGICFTTFQNRGCRLSWTNSALIRIRRATPSSDVQRCLRWLRHAVKPSVQFLIECGEGDAALEALGLVGPSGPSGD